MRPNHKCLLGSSRQRCPDVPRLVGMDLHREFFELLSKPSSRFGPGRCKGDPLGSIFIRRKRPEFLEFAKRHLWIEFSLHSLAFSSSARIALDSHCFEGTHEGGIPSLKKR